MRIHSHHPTRPNRSATVSEPLRTGIRFLAILIALSAWEAGNAAEQSTPDADLQAALQRIAAAPSEAERETELDALDRFDRGDVVRATVRFAAAAKSTRDAMLAGTVFDDLELPESEIVAAVVPLLDDDDGATVQQTRNILAGLERRAADRRPDFAVYRPLLTDAVGRGELPSALVEYLYDADAGEALITLMRAYQIRDPKRIKQIRWAEHCVADVLWQHRFGFLAESESDARADGLLRELSGDEAWWIRLYVAETMRRHTAFRDVAQMRALATDGHPLVRRSAERSLASQTAVAP